MTSYAFGQLLVSPKGTTCTCPECGLMMSIRQRIFPDEEVVLHWAETLADTVPVGLFPSKYRSGFRELRMAVKTWQKARHASS